MLPSLTSGGQTLRKSLASLVVLLSFGGGSGLILLLFLIQGLAMQLLLASNFLPSCCWLLNAEVASMCHHTRLLNYFKETSV